MPGEEDRFEEIEKRLQSLRNREAELDDRMKRWKSERDRLNESARMLREDAFGHRDKRDQVNKMAAKFRQDIRFLHDELCAKHSRLDEVNDERKRSIRSLPPKREVEERLRHIEWKINTTPTVDMMDREKELLDETRSLMNTLDAYEELQELEEQQLKNVADIKAIELRIQEHKEELSRLQEDSDEHHRQMILLFEKADKERKRANEVHMNFLETLQALKEVNEKIRELVEEADRIGKGLREAELRRVEEREKRVDARRRQLIAEARHKMEVGKRLSLNEMKLLYSEEDEE
jgi:phosphoserine phosphatase